MSRATKLLATMSRSYKITITLALIVWLFIALAIISETYRESVWFAWLLFSLPVLWTLWLLCAALETKQPMWRLILFWFFIDLTVLVVLCLLRAGTENMSGPSGDDVVMVVAFFPLHLPLLFVAHYMPVVGNGLSMMASLASNTFGIKGVLSNWLGMSVLSFIPSIIFVGLCHFWRNRTHRKTSAR